MGFALNDARLGWVGPRPNGLSSPMVAPYGAYRTGDGQVLVLGTTNDREWQRLGGRGLGPPGPAPGPPYWGYWRGGPPRPGPRRQCGIGRPGDACPRARRRRS